jgi:5'-3' exonuclease
MIALIDGDVLVYQCGYTTNDVEQWIARARLRDMIKGILETTGATDYQIYLSDSKDNWRLKLFPAYKANRKQPKPTHYQYLQQLLVDEWEAEVAMEQEADDALGIAQVSFAEYKKDLPVEETIICSIDKDLKQIPGYHYNWDKKEIVEISPTEGQYRFWYQLLVGDPGDNITVTEGLSCKGIGDKKATAMLEGCETDEDYYQTCLDAYLKAWKEPREEVEKRLLLTGQLVKIRTKPGEIWSLPKQRAEAQ